MRHSVFDDQISGECGLPCYRIGQCKQRAFASLHWISALAPKFGIHGLCLLVQSDAGYLHLRHCDMQTNDTITKRTIH